MNRFGISPSREDAPADMQGGLPVPGVLPDIAPQTPQMKAVLQEIGAVIAAHLALAVVATAILRSLGGL